MPTTRRVSTFFPAVACLLVAGGVGTAVAPPTQPGDPDRFTVVGGRLIWSERDPEALSPAAYFAPVAGAARQTSTLLRYASQYSVQFRVAHDALWVVSQDSAFDDANTRDSMDRHPLRELAASARRDAANPDSQSSWEGPAFSDRTAAGLIHMRRARGGVTTLNDFVVTGPRAVRQFVLDNHSADPGEETPPKWSMSAFDYETEWDAEAKAWKEAEWKRAESLPVAFREPFTVFAKGGDLYFVTRSGEVWLYAQPAKGKQREAKRVWSDRSRKVVGTVTDAAAGRSFLFLRAPEGGRPAYFELSPTPKPVPFGDKAAPPWHEPTVETGRRYARALLADGRIKPPKDDPEPGE